MNGRESVFKVSVLCVLVFCVFICFFCRMIDVFLMGIISCVYGVLEYLDRDWIVYIGVRVEVFS